MTQLLIFVAMLAVLCAVVIIVYFVPTEAVMWAFVFLFIGMILLGVWKIAEILAKP